MIIKVSESDRAAKINEEGAIDYDEIDKVEIDFSHVRYITSASLREFVILKQKLRDK